MKWKNFYSRFTYNKMLIKSKVIFLELYLSIVLIFKVIHRIFYKKYCLWLFLDGQTWYVFLSSLCLYCSAFALPDTIYSSQ